MGRPRFLPDSQSPIKVTEANRFSVFVKSPYDPDFDRLLGWVSWFKQRGIPAIIGQGHSGYAVYRDGLIPVDITAC